MNPLYFRRVFALCAPVALTVFLACAAAQTNPGHPARGDTFETTLIPPEVDPAQIAAWTQREAVGLKKMKFGSPDAYFSAEIDAAAAPTVSPHPESEERNWGIRVPIGAKVAVECMVTDSDPAQTLRGYILKQFLDASTRTIEEMGAGLVNNRPYLYAELSKLSTQNGGIRHTTLKMEAVALAQTGLLCVHSETGYRKTFQTVVAQLAESLKFSRPAERPMYSEIHLVQINGRDVGFQEIRVYGWKHPGWHRVVSQDGMLFAQSPQEFRAADSLRMELTDAQGTITTTADVEIVNGGTTHNLTLEKLKRPVYAVKGESAGLKIDGQLNTAEPGLRGLLARMNLRKEHFFTNNQTTPLTLETYLPALNPLNTVSAIYQFKRRDGAHVELETAQAANTVMQIDETGAFAQLSMTVGGLTVLTRRVLVQGKL